MVGEVPEQPFRPKNHSELGTDAPQRLRIAGGDCGVSACDARSASRCASTVLTYSRRSSSWSSPRLSRCFR